MDKSSLKQQICGWTLTPFIVTKTGPTLLAVVGLTAGTKADRFQIFKILCLLLNYSVYCIVSRVVGTDPADPPTAGPKFPVATSREPTINNKR